MKKLLLVGILTIGMSASSLAEEVQDHKAGCDKNIGKSCIFYGAGQIDATKDKPLKEKAPSIVASYDYIAKGAKMLKEECDKGQKDSCALQDKVDDNLMFVIMGSFSVDDLYAGMGLDEILINKFKKREDGQYEVMQGTMDMITGMSYGKQLSGNFLRYETEILGEKATVTLFLTDKSKSLYGVIVEWQGLDMESGMNFKEALNSTLEKKYGSSTKLEGKDLSIGVLSEQRWKPNDRAVITSGFTLTDLTMANARVSVTYVDTALKEQNGKEQQTVESTDKL